MATQRFDDAHVLAASPSLLTPQMNMSSYAATFAGAHAIGNYGIRTEPEWPAEAIVNLRLLGKGVGWALGIEGATALFLFALWRLCHLWM